VTIAVETLGSGEREVSGLRTRMSVSNSLLLYHLSSELKAIHNHYVQGTSISLVLCAE
jgi:hypothetical protein